MPWCLRGFQLTGDALVVEHEVPEIDVERLRRTFNLPADDPGYGSYPLDELKAHRLGIDPPPGMTWDDLAWFLDQDAD